MVRQEQEAGVFFACLPQGVLSPDFQVLDEVAFSWKGDFPDDQLGKGDQDWRGLGRNKVVGEVSKFQHPAR